MVSSSRYLFHIKSIWKKVFNSYLTNGSDVKYLHTGHPETFMVFLSATRKMLENYLKLSHNYLPNSVFPTQVNNHLTTSRTAVQTLRQLANISQNKDVYCLGIAGQGRLSQNSLPGLLQDNTVISIISSQSL
jgi:hypothetical protein